MTGSKHARRRTVTLVVAVMVITAACSTGGQTTSVQPTATETGPVQPTATQSSTTETTQTTAPPQPTPVTGIVKGTDGWSTYTNAELGFTLRFPTRTYAANGAPCVMVQEGSDWSYRPADGVVNATVVRDGSKFWVVQKVSWQLGGEVKKKDGTSKFKTCDRTVSTASVLRAYETGNSGYLLNPLPITVSAAATRADVKDSLVAFFWGCPTISLTGTQLSSDGPWRQVAFACPSDPTFPGGMIDIRWYKSQGLFVAFEFGQAYHIYTAKQRPVDQRIAASFTVLP